MTNKSNEKGVKAEKENYTIEVKYSDEAIAKKLVKFTLKKGKSFEISADEIISVIMDQVNTETLKPLFVETDRVNVVYVKRQLHAVLKEDMKAGTTIPIPYIHPYPLEFAILEEAHKIAVIEQKRGVVELTKEDIEKGKQAVINNKQDMEKFMREFYKQFPNVKLEENVDL